MISIIIPVFNKQATLANCLDSILNNGYTDKEVIAVDDGSCDGSAEILEEYAAKGVITVRLERNYGIPYACNVALSKAKGDIIIRTDADTVVPPDWLNKLIAHFEDSDVVAVGGSTYGCLNPDSTIARANSIVVRIGERILNKRIFFNRLPGANRAIRKAFLEAAGGFDKMEGRAEDTGLFLKLRAKGKIIFDPDIVVKTEFPSTLMKLWQRKALWGKDEAGRTGMIFNRRLIFSFLTLLLFILFSLIIYVVIFSLAFLVSLEDKKNWKDLLFAPLILLFSEIALIGGAIKRRISSVQANI